MRCNIIVIMCIVYVTIVVSIPTSWVPFLHSSDRMRYLIKIERKFTWGIHPVPWLHWKRVCTVHILYIHPSYNIDNSNLWGMLILTRNNYSKCKYILEPRFPTIITFCCAICLTLRKSCRKLCNYFSRLLGSLLNRIID